MIEKPEWQGAYAGFLALAKLGINVNIERLVELSNTSEMGVIPEDLVDGIKKICTENGVKINISYIPFEYVEQLKEFNPLNTSIIIFKDTLPYEEYYKKYIAFINVVEVDFKNEKILVENLLKGRLYIGFEELKNGFMLNSSIFMIILEK
jgi:hypothetical protein